MHASLKPDMQYYAVAAGLQCQLAFVNPEMPYMYHTESAHHI